MQCGSEPSFPSILPPSAQALQLASIPAERTRGSAWHSTLPHEPGLVLPVIDHTIALMLPARFPEPWDATSHPAEPGSLGRSFNTVNLLFSLLPKQQSASAKGFLDPQKCHRLSLGCSQALSEDQEDGQGKGLADPTGILENST